MIIVDDGQYELHHQYFIQNIIFEVTLLGIQV